jgi:arabinose-5-phosphate isomerase
MKAPASHPILDSARRTLRLEGEAVMHLMDLLDQNFVNAVETIDQCNGRAVVTGIGKSAIIAQKIVATMNSTGTPALYMHAADAIHGDLGMVLQDDVVICISKSGNSPEIKALAPLIKSRGNTLIGLVGNLSSFLAEQSDIVLNSTVEKEACPNNLAPTTSTSAQLAIGDALAVCLLEKNRFDSSDFAKSHPGGNLGKRLYMRLSDIAEHNAKPTIAPNASIKDAIYAITHGRLGAVVIEENNAVVGIITDGDIRRMLERYDSFKDISAKDIMTANPLTFEASELAVTGASLIKQHKINHLILTDQDRYFGLVHIQDLVREGLL